MNGNWKYNKCSDILLFPTIKTLLPHSNIRNEEVIINIESLKSHINASSDDSIQITCKNDYDDIVISNDIYELNLLKYKPEKYSVYSLLESDNKFENLIFYSYGPTPGSYRYLANYLTNSFLYDILILPISHSFHIFIFILFSTGECITVNLYDIKS